MHELTPESRALVFALPESHPDGEIWDALLGWIRQLAASPLDAAALELPGGILVSFVPGSDIEIAFEITAERTPRIRILRIR